MFYSQDGFYTYKQLARAQHGGVPDCHLRPRRGGARNGDISSETTERCYTYFAAISNGDVLNRTIVPAFRDVLYSHLRHSKECG